MSIVLSPTSRAALILTIMAALSDTALAANADSITVAADGSGQYKTVQEAVNAAPAHRASRFEIRIKPGTYREVVLVPKDKPFLAFVGESAETTVITFDNGAGTIGPDGKPLGTFKTQTVQIEGDDFSAENITFENTAVREKLGQAIALFTNADRLVFRNCRLLGSQDTLFAREGRQYFEKCVVEGDVDFIFGGAVAWFERCDVRCKGGGYITAASTDAECPYGYVFSNCTITAAKGKTVTLGRTWRANAAVTFLNTTMPPEIAPTGWNNFGNPANEKTARYSEFGSKAPDGTPIDTSKRVAWSKQLTADEAAKVTVAEVFKHSLDPWHPTASATDAAAKKVSLTAKATTIKGGNAKLEDDSNIGWWTNADTRFEWQAQLKSGTYVVGIHYAVNGDQAGSEIEVSVGGKTIQATLAPTAGWTDYRNVPLGEVVIDPDASLPVVLTAKSVKGRFVGNIKALVLVAK